MGHQTKIGEPDGAPDIASKGLAMDIGEFAQNVLTLAELQSQLLAADVREFGRQVFVPGAVLLCGVALALACFPLALVALALWLVEVFAISYAAGFSIALGVGTVASTVMCLMGWHQVHGHVTVLRRSQQELVRNLRWIKKVLERTRITRTNSLDNSWRTMT